MNEKTPPSAECRRRRLAILKEYADRYKDKIAGWWFDGVQLSTYRAQPDDWQAIESIVHVANPKAVIAFSYGANEQACVCKGTDDFTGGDTWSKQDLQRLTPQRLPAQEGILWHGKIYCGNVYHGQGDANQFSDQELIDWINTCNAQGGVCTLDWPFDPQTGLLKDFGLAQLKRIARAVKADEPAPQRRVYEPTWESLDRRPMAAWWLDAEFGVYVHWTLASVPGWGNHSSFYWPNLLKSRQMEANGPRPAKNDIAEEYVGLWQSREFLTWLFHESPVPEIVVNDRWGQGCRHRHGGFYTTEFTPGMRDGRHPWEENRTVTRPRAYDAEGRPLWYDWVFNRQLTLENYYSARELVLTLVDTVSRGGNLLLNVGPTPDGRLRALEEERLIQMGDWLKVNGEAIFGTRPWVNNRQWSAGTQPKIEYGREWRYNYDIAALAGKPAAGRAVIEAFFTARGDTLYAILPWWPSGRVVLKGIRPSPQTTVTMLGLERPLQAKPIEGGLVVEVPLLSVDELPCQYAYTLKLTHIERQ